LSEKDANSKTGRYGMFAPNIIFTTLALVISLITLWFTHLKGPDIELCRQPEIVIKDWTEDQLQHLLLENYMPNYLDIESIQLVFVNNGSRAGAITDVRINFEPSKEFKEIYRENYISLENTPNFKNILPVSIPEGGNHVIKLTGSIRTIFWDYEFEYEKVKDLSNFRRAFSQSVELNRKYLEQFIKLLKSNSSLGVLSVDITYLARRWLKTKINTRTIVELEIKCNNKKTIEGFSRLAENWNIELVINKMLISLPSNLNSLISKMNEYCDRLESQIRPTNAQNLDDFKRYVQSLYRSNISQRIILESEPELMAKLKELSNQITLFNYKASLVQSLQGEADDKLIKDINEERSRTRTMAETILSDLKDLRTKIIKDIQAS
jgi:hypothetical protein